MRSIIGIISLVLLSGWVATGCSKPADPAARPPGNAGKPHEHAAPHGGELVELSGGAGHVEFVHSEAAGTLIVHVFDDAMKAINVTEPPVLNLKPASGPRQLPGVAVEGTPAGSSAWSFRDDGLKGHLEGASLRISIGGKSYHPDVPHRH